MLDRKQVHKLEKGRCGYIERSKSLIKGEDVETVHSEKAADLAGKV